MKWIIVCVLWVFAAIIVGCAVYGKAKRSDNRMERIVRILMLCAAVAISVNGLAIAMPWELPSCIAYSVYTVCVDAVVLVLFRYGIRYTGLLSDKNPAIRITAIVAAVDALFMLLNPFLHIMYRTELNSTGEFYRIAHRTPLYLYHIVLVYLLVISTIVMLSIRAAKTPRIYRVKYVTVLVSLVLVLASHIGFLTLRLDFDVSLIVYSFIALSIFFFTLMFVPSGIVESLLTVAVKNMTDGIVCVDINGNCVYANKPAMEMLTTSSYETISEAFRIIGAKRGLESKNEAQWEAIRGKGDDAQYYDAEYKRLFSKKGDYLGCFYIIHDKTAEVNKLKAEQYKSSHDKLTGILNREHFYRAASERITAHPYTKFLIVCTDIKDFKVVNDVYGIETGDRILKNIAARMAKTMPAFTVGRITGDRFAMCLPKDKFNERNFVEEAQKMGRLDDNSVFRAHIHIGVYEVTDRDMAVAVMVDRAQLAIQSIKNSYSEYIAYYSDELREGLVSEQNMVSEFDSALADGQFRMFLQPQISAVTGKPIGGEALVRWLHPEKGMIPPFKFIPAFERTGLISRLDMEIWEQACKKLREWQDAGLDYHISVNISPKDFYFTDVYAAITGLVEKYGISPHKLNLEITETAMMTDLNNQLELVERLREYGFAVEIDDFGSGYSSLNTLKDMNVDTIKIDMGFLRETEHRDRSRSILRMIIALSKQLGLEVITEGVETEEQTKFLAEFGCDVFQGYFFSKPIPVEEFEQKYFSEEQKA